MDNSFKEIQYRSLNEQNTAEPSLYQAGPPEKAPLFRRDEIVYDEGWRSASGSEIESSGEAAVSEPVAVDEQKPGEKPKKPLPVLLSIQLVVCIVAALLLFVLKSLDSGLFHEFSDWFDAEMSKTMVSRKNFDDVDIARFFREATPDEAALPESTASGTTAVPSEGE